MLSRIDRLLESVDASAVFINSYANIFYYSGFTSEDAYLLITKSERYIITDSRYFIQAKIQSPDFELIDIKKGWGFVFDTIGDDTVCFEEDNLTYGMYQRILGNIKGKAFVPSQAAIDMPRSIKDEAEIQIISEAEAIGDKAFSHILEFIRSGMSEREVAVELETYMKRLGATALSFDTIVASGLRSAMPHGTASGKLIGRGDLVTMDFGCVYKGYCSDMTRTIVIGKADGRQREIYDLVLLAQNEALSALEEGIECSAVDAIARSVIADGGYGKNFSHSLGHSVGVEIHENPVFSPKSTDKLACGHVMSVEPGIYIDGFGGVRIEDLIAVSGDKIVNLTHSPKQLIEI